jgi:hypothetical protein
MSKDAPEIVVSITCRVRLDESKLDGFDPVGVVEKAVMFDDDLASVIGFDVTSSREVPQDDLQAAIVEIDEANAASIKAHERMAAVFKPSKRGKKSGAR